MYWFGDSKLSGSTLIIAKSYFPGKNRLSAGKWRELVRVVVILIYQINSRGNI